MSHPVVVEVAASGEPLPAYAALMGLLPAVDPSEKQKDIIFLLIIELLRFLLLLKNHVCLDLNGCLFCMKKYLCIVEMLLSEKVLPEFSYVVI